MKLQIALLLFLGVSCFATKARYDNYKLYSMLLNDEKQAKALADLEQLTEAYDFWSEISMVRDVDIMVSPHKVGEFEDFLTRFNISFHIKNENIQEYSKDIIFINSLNKSTFP